MEDDDLLFALLGDGVQLHDAHVVLWYGFDLTAAGIEDHDIAACPFCKPSCLKPGLMHEDVEGWPVKYVMCYACGARGPSAAKESFALRDWNRRSGRGDDGAN